MTPSASTASSASNELCDVCKTIIHTIRVEGEHKNLIHQSSLSSLSHSAGTACGVCTVLLEHIRYEYYECLRGDAQERGVDLPKNLFPILCFSDTSCVAWQSSFELTLTSQGVEELSLTFTLEALQHSGDQGDGYKPESTTNSISAHELVVSWLQRCVKGHARCNLRGPEKWFPTRVLDIGVSESDDLRLIKGCDALPNQPYATLSHCWGLSSTSGPPLTTMANYQERIAKIRMDELTNTFKDAIHITRSLGLRYLWIDSLCILQDSAGDWAHEAARMGDVYRYGFITVAATGAANGSEGCYRNRDPRQIQRTTVTVGWSKSESRQYQVVPDPDFWARKFVNEPLNQRGWKLQERILSPRVIHFGHTQIFWECRETVACETYWDGLPLSLQQNTFVNVKTLDLGDAPQDKRWPARYTSNGSGILTTIIQRVWSKFMQYQWPVMFREPTFYAAMNDTSVCRDWTTIVELYSLGTLTYSADKLVAISGVASVIVDKRADSPDEYLAGLWQSSLPLHLLWISAAYTETNSTGPETRIPRSYRDYVAPSWSWASIDGKISFAWCHNDYNANEYMATVEEAKVVWANQGQGFGLLESAELTLAAPIATALWERLNSSVGTAPMAGIITHAFPMSHNQGNAVSVPHNPTNEAEIRFDTVLDNTPQELTLLPIISTTKKLAHERELAMGLVLQQLEGSTQLKRLGVFHTTRPRINRILRNLPRQTVTIV